MGHNTCQSMSGMWLDDNTDFPIIWLTSSILTSLYYIFMKQGKY